jgi:hypothetical protein
MRVGAGIFSAAAAAVEEQQRRAAKPRQGGGSPPPQGQEAAATAAVAALTLEAANDVRLELNGVLSGLISGLRRLFIVTVGVWLATAHQTAGAAGRGGGGEEEGGVLLGCSVDQALQIKTPNQN